MATAAAPPSAPFLLLPLVLLLALFSLQPARVAADIYQLPEDHIIYGFPSIRRVIGMYSLEDGPSFLGSPKVDPFIQLDLSIEATDGMGLKSEAEGPGNPRIQAAIIASTTLDGIGHWDTTDSTLINYCCTKALAEQGITGCNTGKIGSLIVSDKVTHKLMDAEFTDKTSAQTRLSGPNGRYDVTTTGEHILLVANCDERLQDRILRVTGGGVWKNPYGFLPGRLYGFLPFYFGMTVVYVALTCTWALLCFIHRKEIAGIQYFISSVLLLTLVEVFAWFMDYYSFNTTGVRNMSGVISAIIFTVLRLTVSRMLVVSVSIGFPVVRPSLSTSTKVKIGVLGLIYFACEAALEVVTRYAQTNETAERWRIFLSLPVAVLNAIFYWWIFTALHDLINFLEQQNQAIKLNMYRTFTHMLAASLVAAVLFALYQIYFMATNQLALHWSLLWLLDGGFALILYSVIFICMAWLWRPSSDARRYAYSELTSAGAGMTSMGMEDEDEFGEVEMGGLDGHHHHDKSHDDDDHHQHISHESAKFTVDDDEEEQRMTGDQ